MKISQAGIDLIKEFEGCRLIAYKDSVGVWTIGYGTTSADKDITGLKIEQGLTITRTVAENWLKLSIDMKYSANVMKYDYIYHWNQNQFDALCSFAYNIGSIDQLTARGTRSIAEISEKILLYNKAGGNVLEGLTRRRKAEKRLFDTPIKKKTYTGEFPELPEKGYFGEGDHGTEVVKLKKFLNWYGNYGLSTSRSASIGDKTIQAINDFKKEHKLTVNGRWGKNCQKLSKKYKK